MLINKTQNMFLVYAKNCIILSAFTISAQRQRYFKDCAILNVCIGSIKIGPIEFYKEFVNDKFHNFIALHFLNYVKL